MRVRKALQRLVTKCQADLKGSDPLNQLWKRQVNILEGCVYPPSKSLDEGFHYSWFTVDHPLEGIHIPYKVRNQGRYSLSNRKNTLQKKEFEECLSYSWQQRESQRFHMHKYGKMSHTVFYERKVISWYLIFKIKTSYLIFISSISENYSCVLISLKYNSPSHGL